MNTRIVKAVLVLAEVALEAALSVVGIQFVSSLDANTTGTTECTHSIFSGRTLNSVLLPGLTPKNKDWNTGEHAGQETAQNSRLP